MKKIFFLLLLLGYSCLVQAQTDNVYISVAMPSDCTLDGNTKSILKNKLLQILLSHLLHHIYSAAQEK